MKGNVGIDRHVRFPLILQRTITVYSISYKLNYIVFALGRFSMDVNIASV